MRKQALKQAFENDGMVVALEALGKNIARLTSEGDQLTTSALPGARPAKSCSSSASTTPESS